MSLLMVLLVACSYWPCNAAENDQKETGDKSNSSCKKKVEDTKKSVIITPEPSISSKSPSFQTSLTKLIRTKGHADQAKKKGDFKKAKKLYLRCIKDPKVNHRALGYCYKNLAQIYVKEGNKVEARKYYKLALQEMKKHKMKRQVESLQDNLLKLNTAKPSN